MNTDVDINTETLPYLFVYGTLKRRQNKEGLEFIVAARTVDKFLLYDGGYPSVRPYEDQHKENLGYVLGELYKITSLDIWRQYDNYEGHPDFFTRKVIDIDAGEGKPPRAWMYFGPKDTLWQRSTLIQPNDDGLLLWPSGWHGERVDG